MRPRPLPPAALAALGLAAGLVLSTWAVASLLLAPCLVAYHLRPHVLWIALMAGVVLGLGEEEPGGHPVLRLPAIHQVEGQILGLPHGRSGTLQVEVTSVGRRGVPASGLRARLVPPRGEEGSGWPGLHPGDEVRFVARLEAPRRLGNPGARRRPRPLLAFVPSRQGVERVREGDGPAAWVARVRQEAGLRFDRALAADDAALARALLLGDRSALERPEKMRFRETGQGHLLAVSGLHVGLLLGGALALLRLLGVGWTGIRWAGLLLVLFYVPLAGAPPSAVRAGGAAALFFTGRLLQRDATPSALLGAVVLIVLLVHPPAHASLAFALSVTAVVGILLLTRPLAACLIPDVPRIPGVVEPPRALVRRSLAVALAAWLATTPFLLEHFGRIALLAAPISVASVPLAALLIGSGAATLFGVPGAPWLFALVADGLRGMLDLVVVTGLGACTAWPRGAMWHVAWGLALVQLARGRRRALLALGLLVMVTLTPPVRAPPPTPRVTLLDVGHGQAALVEVPDGRVALIDAGRVGDPRAGERIIVPALRALGVHRLDVVVVSHVDADHVGAVPAVLEALGTRRLVFPPRARQRLGALARAHGIRARPAVRGQRLLAGAWGRLEVLMPPDRAPSMGGRNDDGLVLRLVDAFGHSVLFPGDLEHEGVRALLGTESELDADVLVLPHHGRVGGGRDVLVARCRARHLVASCGPSLVATLPTGAWSTARQGALVVRLAPEGAHVEAPWPKTERRYHPASPMPPTPHSWIGPLALLAFAVVSVRPLGWLRPPAASAAWVLGTATWFAFGLPGLAALFAPFVVATLLGRLPGARREGARNLRQVVANGAPALMGALLALLGDAELGLPMLLGGLSFLGADTSATEIGVRYGGTPRHVLTGKPMPRGESGGVTPVGLLASVGGAALAPLAWRALAPLPLETIGLVVFAGTAGALADSVLGVSLQWRGRDTATGKVTEARSTRTHRLERVRGLAWLDNDAVNLVGGILSALLAALLVVASQR